MGTSEQQVESHPEMLVTRSPEETMALAAQFTHHCQPNDVVGLRGTLGAGKTCFVKGMARGLGVADLRKVTSPTFVLLQQYAGRLMLYHFDAYRLDHAEGMVEIGCEEIFEAGGVSVVEWADHVVECLPPEHFLWTIRMAGRDRREFLLTASGQQCRCRLERIRNALGPRRI